MDPRRFDALARRLAGRATRRSVIAATAGAVIGTSLLARGDARVCRPGGYGCTRSGQCCTGSCDSVSSGSQQRLRCRCEAGTTLCGTRCVSLTDTRNCGGCSLRCRTGESCVGGRCTPPSTSTPIPNTAVPTQQPTTGPTSTVSPTSTLGPTSTFGPTGPTGPTSTVSPTSTAGPTTVPCSNVSVTQTWVDPAGGDGCHHTVTTSDSLEAKIAAADLYETICLTNGEHIVSNTLTMKEGQVLWGSDATATIITMSGANPFFASVDTRINLKDLTISGATSIFTCSSGHTNCKSFSERVNFTNFTTALAVLEVGTVELTKCVIHNASTATNLISATSGGNAQTIKLTNSSIQNSTFTATMLDFEGALNGYTFTMSGTSGITNNTFGGDGLADLGATSKFINNGSAICGNSYGTCPNSPTIDGSTCCSAAGNAATGTCQSTT